MFGEYGLENDLLEAIRPEHHVMVGRVHGEPVEPVRVL
jgi:hypothetical protein